MVLTRVFVIISLGFLILFGFAPSINSDPFWLSPVAQQNNGVELGRIVCPEGTTLIMKKSNQSPACVKDPAILLQRGWGLHILPEYAGIKNTNSDMFESGSHQVISEMVEYSDGSFGYFARPAEEMTRPGIVMIHEWWGLNGNVKQMAEKLASHGYAVLAVDLYNGEVAKSATVAGSLIKSYDSEVGIALMRDSAEYLKSHGAEKIGSIGWCFGGRQSLNFALNVENDATVIYYGQPELDTSKLEKIKSPILGIYGKEDAGIPEQSVLEFQSALDDLGIENHIHIYDGVGHAFANPSNRNYSADEANDAWQKTLEFFEQNLA